MAARLVVTATEKPSRRNASAESAAPVRSSATIAMRKVVTARGSYGGRTELVKEALHGDVRLVAVSNELPHPLSRDIEKPGAALGTELACLDQLPQHVGGGEPSGEPGLQ